MRNGLWFGAVVFILAGCGSLTTIEPDPQSRFYTPPVGTLVILNEELTVPGGWARVFLQHGKTVSYGDVNRYAPSCDFALRTVDEVPQSIKPGSFKVVDVQPRTEEIVEYRPVQYAGRWLLAAGNTGSGGQYMIMQTLRMTLESAEQPGMYMLTCRGALDDPPNALRVSISEMREALGNKAFIILPEGSSGESVDT